MPEALTANQVVAYNLMRIRKKHGLTQAEATAKLAPYLGAEWSATVYSAAERSYAGNRVRQFSADDITAFALAFSVPVAYFWMPPGTSDGADGITAGEHHVPWRDLFAIIADYRGDLAPRLDELGDDELPADQLALRALLRGADDRVVRLVDLDQTVADMVAPLESDLAELRQQIADVSARADTIPPEEENK